MQCINPFSNAISFYSFIMNVPKRFYSSETNSLKMKCFNAACYTSVREVRSSFILLYLTQNRYYTNWS